MNYVLVRDTKLVIIPHYYKFSVTNLHKTPIDVEIDVENGLR